WQEFLRQVIVDSRSGKPATVDETFVESVERKLQNRFTPGLRVEKACEWLEELVAERILVRNSSCPNDFQLNPQPIVGETATERFEQLPPDVSEKPLPLGLVVLYAVNSFLFLVLSFFFLPDSVVNVLVSAVRVVVG